MHLCIVLIFLDHSSRGKTCIYLFIPFFLLLFSYLFLVSHRQSIDSQLGDHHTLDSGPKS